MNRAARGFACLILLNLVWGCRPAAPDGESGSREIPWLPPLPPGIGQPPVPEEYPVTAAKVQLGRWLFYEPGLSVTGELACAGCHHQERAFAGREAVETGALGHATPRNSPGLANLAWARVFTWANPVLESLETQAIVPLFGDTPVEMGAGLQPVDRLRDMLEEKPWPGLWAAAFNGEAPGEDAWQRVTEALAAFQRALISLDSPYDRWLAGDHSGWQEDQERGRRLFFGRAGCSGCHSGPFLSLAWAGPPDPAILFRNTGLYVRSAPENPGLAEFTLTTRDEGKFRIPSLRNVAVTAPYMHDGSLTTLEAVLDHYRRGGRPHPARDPAIVPLDLGDDEVDDLLAFLRSLTDPVFLSRPDFADPRTEKP